MAPKRSYVWKYFTKENAIEVKCKLCLGKFKSSNNTSNMMQHLKMRHPEVEALKASLRNSEPLRRCFDGIRNKTTPKSDPLKIISVQKYQSDGVKQERLSQSIFEMDNETDAFKATPKDSETLLYGIFDDEELPSMSVKTPQRRSYVWTYFSKENEIEVKCKLCCKKLKSSNNTSNMMQHLKLKHPRTQALKASHKISNALHGLVDDEELPTTRKNKNTSQCDPLKIRPVTIFSSGGVKQEKLSHPMVEIGKEAQALKATPKHNEALHHIFDDEESPNSGQKVTQKCEPLIIGSVSTGIQSIQSNDLKQQLIEEMNNEVEVLRPICNNDALRRIFEEEDLPSAGKIITLKCDPLNVSPVHCSNARKLQSGGLKQEKLTQSIVEMIIIDNLPFSHVEGKGFLQLMKQQFPFYNVPSKNTIKIKTDQLYNKEAENFKKMLLHVSNMCLTTDIWTDIELNNMFSVTVHGLFESKQFYGTIGVFKLNGAHTATHISDILNSSLSDFCINKKNVIAVVTDDDTNVVKAIHNAFGKDHHVTCIAHTLNQIGDSALNTLEVSNIIRNCRTIVTWFKRHVKATDNLQHLQISAGIPESKALKLVLDVKSRWNSTYYMLDRFIKLTEYISQILKSFSDAPPMISTKDKDEIMEIINVLRCLAAMTNQISAEKYATLSQIIPLAHCGQQQIMKIVCKSEVAAALKTTILKEFDSRFGELENSFLMAASTLLDPRFKKVHFQDPTVLASVMRQIRIEMAEIEQTEDNDGAESDTSANEFDLWAPHKSLAHKRKRYDDDCAEPQDELYFFLNAPLLKLDQDVLTAWNEMKSVYPKLYTIARKYAFLIGTSIPSERLFSKSGATATEWRNRLTTKRLPKLLFLHSILNK